MKYFSHNSQYINAECQNCGRVLKTPHKNCAAVSGGFAVTPAVLCQCGTVSNFIDDISSQHQKNASWTPQKNDNHLQKLHHLQELINLIERFLPLNKWDFKQSAQLAETNYHSVVIYDSDKCRFKATYSTDSYHMEDNIRIDYGRLGIPDDSHRFMWKTKRENSHLCWHDTFALLKFLDGLSPEEAYAEREPRLVREFKQSELAKEMWRAPEPEKDLALEALIWETYGQRLFDIFDAHNRDLWVQYSAFASEYWK